MDSERLCVGNTDSERVCFLHEGNVDSERVLTLHENNNTHSERTSLFACI